MIYVASSWTNKYFDATVKLLEFNGFKVYNFKEKGFMWDNIDPNWQERWDFQQYKKATSHKLVVDAFSSSWQALQECSSLLLILPCGNDAHLEAGYAAGQHKNVIVYKPKECEDFRPGLMYGLAWNITDDMSDILFYLSQRE